MDELRFPFSALASMGQESCCSNGHTSSVQATIIGHLQSKPATRETEQAQVISPTACSALFSARTTPQPSQNLVERGTLVEPWWNPGGALPQGSPGPPWIFAAAEKAGHSHSTVRWLAAREPRRAFCWKVQMPRATRTTEPGCERRKALNLAPGMCSGGSLCLRRPLSR